MNKRNLKVGIIGLGVGEEHIYGYQRHPACIVSMLCDFDEDKLAKIRLKYPDIMTVNDTDDILKNPNIDVVSIASFDNYHYEQVIKALANGKHVFVEKPLCQTLDQLHIIKQIWARNDGKLKLACNLVLRAAPLYKWLKEKVRTGDFGEVYAFDGDYLYGRLHKIAHGWRRDVEDYSVMQGGGIHLIDLMMWLTGQRPSVVSAIGNRFCTRGTAFRYNDYVTAIMQSPSGMVSRISANFGCVHAHQHVVRLFGTKATFLYDDVGARLHINREPAVDATPINFSSLPTTKGDLIPDFVSAIIKDEEISGDTQAIFDGISISVACDKALNLLTPQEVKYI